VLSQQVGEIEGRPAFNHDVNDGSVVIHLAFGSLIKTTSDGDVFSSALPAHVFHVHCNEHLVCQDEDTQTIQRIVYQAPPSIDQEVLAYTQLFVTGNMHYAR